MNLDNLVNLAISECIPASKEIDPGKYAVSGVAKIELNAIIAKSSPTMYTPTADLPLKNVIAVFVKKYNIKMDELQELLVEAYKLSLINETSVAEELDYTEKALGRVIKTLDKLPQKPRAGKTSVQGMAKIIELTKKIDVI